MSSPCLPLVVGSAALVWFTACSDRIVHPLTRAGEDSPDETQLVSIQDEIVFGDSVSERAHELAEEGSETTTGLGESARRLLPRDPPEIYGGDVSFVMKVDPGRQNYLTVKFWGSDVADSNARLFLYCEGRQVGYRNQGDHDALYEFTSEPAVPGRFLYVTQMLPLTMTFGRDRVSLQIVSAGRIAPFSQTTYDDYQRTLSVPTGSIYRAYTHINPYFDPSGEAQGEPPPESVRSAPTEDSIAAVQARVDQRLELWLSQPELEPHAVWVLAQAYRTSWSVAFENPDVIEKIVEQIDLARSLHDADPARFAGGLLPSPPLGDVVDPFYPELSSHFVQLKSAGPLGAAVDLLYPELLNRLDDMVTPSSSGPAPRREEWATLFESTRDLLRTRSRGQLLPEHELLVDTAIYYANLGLRRLAAERAFPENEARRYLFEATGVLPALGNDTDGEPERPFGDQYYLFSRAGLAKSLGYASAHGELVDELVALWELTRDSQIRERAVALARARAFFRYPGHDADLKRAMRLEGPIGYKSAEYPGPVVYAARRSELVAAVALSEPDLVGYAQQALSDHQVLDRLEDRPEPEYFQQLLALPDQLARISEQPPSEHRLPMSEGQPDSVFADDEAGVVAVHRDVDVLYISLFRRALAVNGIARIHHVRRELERVATAEVDVQFTTDGEFWTRPDAVDWMAGGSAFEPPDGARQAFAGERALFATAPAEMTDARPFSGKALFYRLHYGHYLVGMNTSQDRTFELSLPLGVDAAEEVQPRRTVRPPILVEPRSTRVLYLSSGIDTRPRPFAPRFLTALRSDGRVTLDWDPVSGATSYRVERAASSGGRFSTVGTRVTESTFVDQTADDATAYHYVVIAENGYGESAPSPELPVAPR